MTTEEALARRAARREVRLKEIHADEQLALDSLRNYPHDHWGGIVARVALWMSRQYRRLMWQDPSPPGAPAE